MPVLATVAIVARMMRAMSVSAQMDTEAILTSLADAQVHLHYYFDIFPWFFPDHAKRVDIYILTKAVVAEKCNSLTCRFVYFQILTSANTMLLTRVLLEIA